MKERLNCVRRTYTDGDGNLYFVHNGTGGMKGFRLLRNPGKGQQRESGIQALGYVDTLEQAQQDLDSYAQNQGLTLCAEGSKVCNL